MLKRPFGVLVPLVLMVFQNVAFAQNKTEDVNSIQDPNQQVLELQQRIDRMQRRYDSEIRVLKEQIDRDRAVSGETEKEVEIQSLQDLAKAEAAKETVAEAEFEEQTFTSGALGLQALNPEISVTGDLLFSYREDATSDQDSDFSFRNLGVHLESWLDPY